MKASTRSAVILIAFCLIGCHARGPAPQEVLDRLRAFVESEGHQTSSGNVFSMPGMAPSAGKPSDTFTVKSISYNSTLPPLRQPAGDIPAGSVMYYYAVEGTRTHPDGSQTYQTRLFYVYTDASGNWQFMENKTGSSYDSEPSMPAAK
jgi:hypothetical protein